METELTYYFEGHEKKMLPPHEEYEKWLDPDSTAIVCIDMHRGHVGPEDDVTCPAPRARAKIPAHDLFHKHCRDLGIPVIMVQHWQRYGGIDDINPKKPNRKANWRVLCETNWPPNPLMDEHSWEGTKWLDLMVENDSERDYYVRTKKRLSAFYPTDLEFLLRQLDVQNIVITGTFTDCCNLSTAFDAANRDYRVILPRDVAGRAGLDERAEDAALLIIALYLGLVVDAPALLAEWYARKGISLPAELEAITDISEVAGEIEVAA